MVVAFILVFFERIGKHLFGLVYLHPNFREIAHFQRCTMFVYQGFDVYIIVL